MIIGINTLFLIPNKHGGTETYLRNLLHSILNNNNENDLFIFCNKKNYDSFNSLEKYRKILCRISASNKLLRVAFEQTFLPFVAQKNKIDVLHSPGYVAPVFLKAKSIITIHDMMYHYYPQNYPKNQLLYFKNFIPASARKADKIIAVSQNTKKDIVEILNIPEEKVVLIHEACGEEFKRKINKNDKERIKTQYKLPNNYILSVASLNPQKNIERLIKAYDLLIKRYALEHKLVLVGMWLKHGNIIMEVIEKLNIKDKIIFTGYVNNEDLPCLYSLADVFVFPSYFEGFGIPPLEAMACGCPVVASNVTSIPEVVGESAILVNPFDIEELLDAMYRVLTNKDMRNSLIAKGVKRVEQFSWEKAARETLQVYKETHEM